VLAAGLARRFGGNKLLANYGGRAIVSHVLDALSAAQARGLIAGIYVVAAAGDDAIADLTRRVGATLVTNPDPSSGLSSSVKLGLAALPATLDAVLVFLGDQPTVRGEVIERLIDAWQQGDSAVVRPRYAGAPHIPGHPVLLARSAWSVAGRLEGDVGFGSPISSGEVAVGLVDVAGDNPDVNTLADLLGLEDRQR
jgi:molybdenum cofactor cytidylyltransferase